MKNKKCLLCLLVLMIFLPCLTGHAQVNYRVTGIPQIIKHSSGTYAILRTGDGRIFNLVGLEIPEIKKFEGKNVYVEGAAKRADQIHELRVKKMAPVELKKSSLVLPPFKAHQTPPQLVSKRGYAYSVNNVRWGYIPGKQRNNNNFRYQKTTFDVSKVDRAFFVLKPFPPEWIAAHSLLFFKFKPGGMVSEKGEESAGVFLSIEAYQRTNQNYDLKEGLKNTFGVSWILAGWEDYTTQSCEVQNEKLFMYPLRLTQGQMSSLLAETILQATANRKGEYYNTITNNCTNNLIVLLNRVLPVDKRINLWWLPSMVYNMRATTPVVVPKMLMKKGLMGSNSIAVNKSNFNQIFPLKRANSAPPPVRPIFR